MKTARVSLLALMAGAALPGLAAAQTLDPIVRIASGTVFPNCTADQGGNQPGTNFPGSVIEPWLTVDPTLTGHLLTGVQQDRWSSGGSRGLRAGVSGNGGKSWKTSVPSGTSACAGGKFQRATDPWTAIGLDGTSYFFSLAIDNNPSASVNGESAMLVSRSLDGGLTWAAPVTLIDDTDPKAFNDKNSITADPKIPGNAYAVWDRLYGAANAFRDPGGSDEGGHAAAATAQDGVQMTRNRIKTLRAVADGTADATTQAAALQVTHGPTYYSRTTDSGVTWSKAVPIYDPGAFGQTIGNVVVGLPNGDLLDFFTHLRPSGFLSIDSIRSRDHGATWSKTPVKATAIGNVSAVTPDTQSPIRSADIVFSVTSDLVTGNLYVVWQDKLSASGSQQVSVFFTQSTDGGTTWSAPTRINKTPANAAVPLRGQGFNGTIGASPTGTLIATYYDFRNDTSATGQELADTWVVFCTPTAGADCTNAANWGREARLTPKSFNFAQAPLTDAGLFLGDYFAVGVQGSNAWPAFTAVTGPGQTTLYTRPIHLPAPATH